MFETPLEAAASLGGIGLILELIAVLLRVHLVRRLYYLGSLLFTAFGATLLFLQFPTIPVFLIVLIAVFRIFNAMRVLSRYTDEKRSYQVTNRTSMVLVALQLLSIDVFIVSQKLSINSYDWLVGMLLAAFFAIMILLISTLKNLAKTNIRPSDKYVPDAELPSVSVCIPARNETSDLPDCLALLLASDYPKLEVLVLDDCSHDRTSEIIKGFAQEGVRFISGEAPKKGWLAKNQAYQTLTEAASGELLLFCGVDVRFDKRTIRYLVSTLHARHKLMLSVLPKSAQNRHHASLIQPMRYWWELVLPRKLFNRPPVLSTAWLIEKSALEELHYFKSVSNTVIPEAFFAREFAKEDNYTFIRSNGKLQLKSNKSFNDQWDTAIRLRYPQLRKRPESVMLLTLAELWLLILPFVIFIAGFFVDLGLIWTLAGINFLTLGYIHYRILLAMGVKQTSWLLAAFPVACVTEILLTLISMSRYEFGTIEWKDRNICIPVMRAIPRLPKLS